MDERRVEKPDRLLRWSINSLIIAFLSLLLMNSVWASGDLIYADVPGNPPRGAVPNKKFLLIAGETDVYIDDEILYKAWTFNGTVPGPLIYVEEGDLVEITIKNNGKYTHGASIHAANTQTSIFVGNVPPGQSKSLVFKADFPGVYMYHCAPGGHGILTHTMAGMYGMIVVEPKKAKYKLQEELGKAPDLLVFLIQHEIYQNGQDFVDGTPTYVLFNGKVFRYLTDPIKARPGDYVRFYFLNVGPNSVSSFHAVGGIWEYVYHGGNPYNIERGLQTVTVGPTDSYVIEWRVPSEGNFLLVTHAFGTQTLKGAAGYLSSDAKNERTSIILPSGPLAKQPQSVKRVIAPFEPTDEDRTGMVVYPPGSPILIRIIGNTYYPKIAKVPLGSQVRWVNEDVLSIGSGEVTGQHNIAIVSGPSVFASELLKNAESFTYVFNREGEYKYICGIHPYMKGEVIVYTPSVVGGGASFDITSFLAFVVGLAVLLSYLVLGFRQRSSK
ncbi:MAG: multicopper oxidase domain-containing protein [Aigarchaeota archaeon]|nr:multicopper oxidase domain-containing protein [Aigarchaeota archaeon]MDW8092838.1 multicopper oxidase domain-containing protein [Nitrososphaerota archaeon]